jgi:hypothetical protein
MRPHFHFRDLCDDLSSFTIIVISIKKLPGIERQKHLGSEIRPVFVNPLERDF